MGGCCSDEVANLKAENNRLGLEATGLKDKLAEHKQVGLLVRQRQGRGSCRKARLAEVQAQIQANLTLTDYLVTKKNRLAGYSQVAPLRGECSSRRRCVSWLSFVESFACACILLHVCALSLVSIPSVLHLRSSIYGPSNLSSAKTCWMSRVFMQYLGAVTSTILLGLNRTYMHKMYSQISYSSTLEIRHLLTRP